MPSYTLAFVGHGFMARAILKGILENGVIPPEKILVVNAHNPAGAETFAKEWGIAAGPAEALSGAEAVLLAFKPQGFPAAMPVYAPKLHAGQLVISILAGIELRDLAAALPEGVGVIRTMPNLALSVGLGATAWAPGEGVTPAQEALCEKLFAAAGLVRRVTEPELAGVTALSGSGPAYFYYLAECMIRAAAEAGMEEETARTLCRQTLLGTAAMWQADPVPPEELRRRITSAKGTTDAAVRTMEAAGLAEAVGRGMEACRVRSVELGREAVTK